MYMFRKLMLIFLISLPGIISERTDNSHCIASKKLDDKCGSYCYGIMKPLLQYASSVRSKEDQFTALKNKILSLESTTMLLENQLGSCRSQKKYGLTKDDLLASNTALVDQIKDYWNSEILKLKSENDANLDKIRELEELLTKKEKEIIIERQKDIEIQGLRSQVINDLVNITKLETKLAEMKMQLAKYFPYSCLGKDTDIYEIKVPGSSPFNVSCDSSLVDSGWTVIQRRQDGSENFNRTMKDYRKGFGNLNREFFVGLDKLYALTNVKKHELYIYMKYFNDDIRYARYSHFLIEGAQKNFKIKSLGNHTGNAGDAMASNLNMEFSTPEEDHDNSKVKNYAKIYNSGWWFNDCGDSMLNGEYQTREQSSNENGIIWHKLSAESMKFVQMMIRPVP